MIPRYFILNKNQKVRQNPSLNLRDLRVYLTYFKEESGRKSHFLEKFDLPFNPLSFMQPVFPKEILEYCTEQHRFKNLKKHRTIYLIILLWFSSVLISLPFIKIDLYRNANGVVKSAIKRNQLSNLIDGRIAKVHISENSHVTEGDTLLSMDDSSVVLELKTLNKRLFSLMLQVNDLAYLSASEHFRSDSLKSTIYVNQLAEYLLKEEDLHHTLINHLHQYKVQEPLFEKGLITEKEFQKAAFGLKKSRKGLDHFKTRQKNKWQHELHQKSIALDSIRLKKSTLQKIKTLHHVIAPESGNIHEFKDLERNNYLYRGSSIAEIAPQTDLVVECYLPPADISLLHIEQEVKFQLDNRFSSDFKTIPGRIIFIQQEITKINGIPSFRVLCSINESSLFQNKNIKSVIYKGMNLTVRFFIKNRSLLQLLFGKLEG